MNVPQLIVRQYPVVFIGNDDLFGYIAQYVPGTGSSVYLLQVAARTWLIT